MNQCLPCHQARRRYEYSRCFQRLGSLHEEGASWGDERWWYEAHAGGPRPCLDSVTAGGRSLCRRVQPTKNHFTIILLLSYFYSTTTDWCCVRCSEGRIAPPPPKKKPTKLVIPEHPPCTYTRMQLLTQQPQPTYPAWALHARGAKIGIDPTFTSACVDINSNNKYVGHILVPSGSFLTIPCAIVESNIDRSAYPASTSAHPRSREARAAPAIYPIILDCVGCTAKLEHQ